MHRKTGLADSGRSHQRQQAGSGGERSFNGLQVLLSSQERVVLGVDHGERRTGLALSDAITATIRDNVPSDFNGDGYSDMVMAAPGEANGSVAAAGAINVVYGMPTGLSGVNGSIQSRRGSSPPHIS